LTISDTSAAIRNAAAILGEAIGVDRICILEEAITRREPRVKEVLDWRRRLGPNGRAPLTSSFLWIQPSIEAWSDDLHRGQVVEVDSGDLGGEAGQTARSEGIRSIMIVPAQVGDDVWGYVCFVDRHGKKRWTDHEKWVLMTVAAGIAGAVKQRRVEEAYREGQDRLRGIVENALDLICELGEDGRYVYASPSHASTMGYSTEDLLGRDFFEFIHSDEREWVRKEFQLALASRSSVHLEVRYRHASGAWRMLGINGKPYRSVTGEVLAVLVSRDITRRKQVEDELLKSNKLESLGILAGGIAHDFNNILGILWSNISLAKLLARDRAIVVEHLAEAERVLTRARDMTKQLLTFARGGEPVKRTASLADLVRESARFSLSGTGVAIQITEAVGLWPVDVDEGQINQVFNNIFMNAHQAMPEGGTITVSVENAYVTQDRGTPLPAGRYVAATVRDTGIGMDSGTITRIFDPYFTTKQDGSGLGLTTAYSIVKKHNGHISVSSQEGEGAVFTVYLPASTASSGFMKTPAAGSLDGSGRILVMDDEEAFRRALVQLLREAGYEAEAACDGREAVGLYSEALRQGRPYDAVIMDLTVPGGVGGKETIDRLRELDPNVRAIASSGCSDDPIMAEYGSYGFAAVLAKPYSAGELAAALHACSQLDAQRSSESSDDSSGESQAGSTPATQE
jgi:PAS domain S-box-containing protein